MLRAMMLVFAVVTVIGLPSVSTARADWALAFGQDGAKRWAFGSSWNKDAIGEAKRKALASCSEHGPNCKVVLQGAGGCVALAVGIDDNAWHAIEDKTRLGAAETALAMCVKTSAGDCEIRHSFCEN